MDGHTGPEPSGAAGSARRGGVHGAATPPASETAAPGEATDRRIDRRRLLAGGALIAGGVVLGAAGWGRARWRAPASVLTTPPLPEDPFTLGVASGDPLSDGVVLWTRLAPEPLAGGGMPRADVPVRWEVAADPRFRRPVRRGRAIARARDAHSVHVDVRGLAPGRPYWYRFRVGRHVSPTGRTRTAPPPGRDVPVRFAFASCQSWPSGYYNAYAGMAAEDLDVVLYLGDYIYEGGPGGPVRQHNSPEVTDLAGYRTRYALYRTDPDLQEAHRRFCWIVTWDDHEVENDYAGLVPEPGPPQDFPARRAAAYRAWWEHQPIRLAPPRGPDLRIYRTFAYGRGCRFLVLDTRQYRSDQTCGIDPFTFGPRCADAEDPARTLTGETQERWLRDRLRRSGARWNVVGQQVMVGPVNFLPDAPDGIWNHDQWDGYLPARRRFIRALAEARGDALVVTGDIHSSWVNDLHAEPDDPDSPKVATELVGTSISSSFPAQLAGLAAEAARRQPTVRYFEPTRRGYVRVRLDRREARADYRTVASVTERGVPTETTASFRVAAGRPGAEPA